MKTQHTPGPWFRGCCTNYACQVIAGSDMNGDPNTLIATAHHATINPTQEISDETRANCYLLASAPTLLEALQDIELRLTQARLASGIGRQTTKQADFLRGECERIAQVARQAIARATGDQP